MSCILFWGEVVKKLENGPLGAALIEWHAHRRTSASVAGCPEGEQLPGPSDLPGAGDGGGAPVFLLKEKWLNKKDLFERTSFLLNLDGF